MNPHEIDSVMLLAEYYRDEAEIPIEDYDENSIMAMIKHYASAPEYFLFLGLDGARPVGLIAGYLTPVPWNKKQANAHCNFLFLLKSHRTMDNFRLLYNNFEEWAKMRDARRLSAGDIGINFDRTEKIWSHFGFESGCWMNKELAHG